MFCPQLTGITCDLSKGHDMQKPYQVNILFAGFDDKAGASLYWMDYLATMHKMNIAGTGYGAPDKYMNTLMFC